MARIVGTLLVTAVSVGACGRGPLDSRPVPSLSASLEAQRVFAPLREAWNDAQRIPRAECRARLEAFLKRWPRDGLASLARVYLAFHYLEANDDARARSVLAETSRLRPGATRDLATVAQAKLLRRQGQPARAFELLQPLVGKLVDADARGVFGEELTLASVESRHAYEAVAYLDAWLRASPEGDRDATRGSARKILERIEPDVLLGTLRTMRGQPAAGGYSGDLQRMVTERLAAVAIERTDSELARWLVGAGRAPLPGELGEQLGELATTKRGVINVSGRTLGLSLPTRVVLLQDEAAEVIRGLAFALDLTRSDPKAGGAIRLATKDAPEEPDARDARLDELAGEGVAAIVTALDPASADSALRWAEIRHVPVLVLAAPHTIKPGPWGFVLGEAHSSQLAALAGALATRKLTRVAPVTEHDEALEAPEAAALTPLGLASRGACEAPLENAAASPFPLAEWRKENVHGWVAVDASAECARRLMRWLGSDRHTGLLALTLEASGAADRAARAQDPDLGIVTVATGLLPVLDRDPPPELAAFIARHGRAPDWWTAVGRDAGELVRLAFAGLPVDMTTQEGEVRRRRELVRRALERAQATLWTSEQRGLAAGHVLQRALRAVDVGAAVRKRE